MTTINWVQLGLNTIILGIGLYILYWRSYINEKGKNRAIKKDIEEITKKIETIKNETSINALLKQDYFNDKKKSALNFLDSISIWTDLYLRPLDYIVNNHTDVNLIKQLISDLKKHGAEANTAYWKLKIYYEDADFLSISDKLFNSCKKIHNLTNYLLIQLERIAIQLEYYNALYKTIPGNQMINNTIKEEGNKSRQLLDQYIKDREDFDKNSNDLRTEYINVLSIRLKH